jgi:hypothetical protein
VSRPKTTTALVRNLRTLSNRLFIIDRRTRERTGCLETGDGQASRLITEAIDWILAAEQALRRGDGDRKPSQVAEPGKSKAHRETEGP